MTGSECFDFLTQFENLVLLTVSDKNYIIPSFFHKKFGNELLGEPIIAAALCGFSEKAYPTRIKIDKTLNHSEKEHKVPSQNDFINIKSRKDIEDLIPSEMETIPSFILTCVLKGDR